MAVKSSPALDYEIPSSAGVSPFPSETTDSRGGNEVNEEHHDGAYSAVRCAK